jgi:hypothetical protein
MSNMTAASTPHLVFSFMRTPNDMMWKYIVKAPKYLVRNMTHILWIIKARPQLKIKESAITLCQSFLPITNRHTKVTENLLYSFRLSNAFIYSVDRTDTRTFRSISMTQALTLQLSGAAMMLQQ